MSGMELLVGSVLPYVAAVAFVGGIAYRFSSWSRTPQPGKLTLYPTEGWDLASAAKEAMFFPNLFKGDKVLWLLAWTFHAALALALLGHLRVVTGFFDAAFMSAGLSLSHAGFAMLSTIAGGAAGAALVVAAIALLLRRLFLARIREISSGPDFFALLLIVAVIASGDALRFGSSPVDVAETRIWARSLVMLSPRAPTNPAILLHALFAELLICYLPLSKLIHFGGLFYTMPLVRRS